MQADIGLVQLRAGDALIDLVDVNGAIGRQGGAAPGPEGRNLDHFCLRVEPFDADAIRRGLATHGVTLGEVVQRYGAHGEGPSCYLSDPDGNVVELKGAAVASPALTLGCHRPHGKYASHGPLKDWRGCAPCACVRCCRSARWPSGDGYAAICWPSTLWSRPLCLAW